jgi:putative membrane protein
MSQWGEHLPPVAGELVKAAAVPVSQGLTGMRKVMAVLLSGLGVKSSTSPKPESGPMDTGTQLAHDRTDLAMERTYFATERTLMAWIRTALSMISFGFTIGKIGQALHDVDVKSLRGMRQVSVGSIADLLVIFGTAALIAATVQYSIRVHALHEQGLKRELSLAFIVAVGLAFLGLFAFSALVMEL